MSSACHSAIPIVLTATVVPNGVHGTHSDWKTRRLEYLAALDFYRRVAPVYFLENSSYDVLDDPEFTNMEGTLLRKAPMSKIAARGKGYQEFELLDWWFTTEAARPARWVKVTGRYLFQNIGGVLREFAQEQKAHIIIDQYGRSQLARTGIFCVESDFYDRTIRGMYQDCDDGSGKWSEVVLFCRLARAAKGDVRLFCSEPALRGISGVTGRQIWVGGSHYRLKVAARALNRLLDQRYLWIGR